MRRKSGLKNILWLTGMVIVGALFHTQVKGILEKIPILKDMVAKVEENQTTN